MTPEEFDSWLRTPARPPLVMGVLNVTPDSFSDGGRFDSAGTACAEAEVIAAAGADLIDVGGESTRPGALPISEDEQIRRVLPAIRHIRQHIGSIAVSIDTTRSGVAQAAFDAGATLVNDISAGRDDAAMLQFVAERHLPVVLMHMQGTPQTMQKRPSYGDVVAEITAFLQERRDAAIAAGVAAHRILLDPGLGFGKTDSHNLTLLRETARLAAIGSPLVIGASRKAFIGRVTGEIEPMNRIFGTAAAVAWSVANGAGIVRVHDAGPMKRLIRMIRAIQLAGS